LTIDEVAFRIEMVVHAGVDGGEFLQRLHLSKSQHRPPSSPEWPVAVFHPVVQPPAHFATIWSTQFPHGRRIGSQPARYHCLRLAWRLSTFFMNRKAADLSRLFRDIRLQQRALVINGAPEIVHLPVDFDVHLVEVPLRWQSPRIRLTR